MPCQLCGRAVPTRKTTLYYNIGMIAARRHSTIQGEFCRTCTSHYFWEYTLVTVVLGWWGLISFFLTPLILVANLVQWVGALRLPHPQAIAPTSSIPQCPRCRTFQPTGAGFSKAVWASLVVSGLLIVWATYLTIREIQQPAASSNWPAVVLMLAIVGLGLVSFVMLLRSPLARCTQCGYAWPAASV
jgi:hypothetical protein